MNFIDILSIFLPAIAFICVVIILSLNIYIKIRSKSLKNVNCWFCNQWSKVPYEYENSWDCSYCDQYNGFTKDGDYNKPIPAQHDELMNKVPTSSQKSCLTRDNGLCNVCNNNQQLKIHQLAMFSPIDENKFDEEVDRYKRQLERAYRLCPQCEQTVKSTLHKQKSFLLAFRLSTLKKKGLDYIDLNKSLPGISKTAKLQLFLSAIRLFTIGLAFIHIFRIVTSCDFTDGNLKNTLPKVFLPYVLFIRNLMILSKNAILSSSLTEYLKDFYYFLLNNSVAIINLDFLFLTSFTSFTNFITLSHGFILPIVGAFLQIVFLTFNGGNYFPEFMKCVLWIMLAFSTLGNFSDLYKILQFSSKFVEIILCCLIVTMKPNSAIAKSKKHKKKKHIEKNKSASMLVDNEFSDDEFEANSSTELLNSTFKTTNSDKLNLSSNSSKSSKSYFSTASTMKLFDADSMPAFGQKPVFENPLNSYYFNFAPKYRSENSSNDSYSTRKSLNESYYNDRLNDSFSSDKQYKNRSTEQDLNKVLSDLHLSSNTKSKKHIDNSNLPPVFHVSSPFLARPKPVLSPPKLSNITQSSWVAGGYWKSNNDFLNNTGGFTNLSRSSSQSSGFGSQASSQQPNNFDHNVFNSLPPSRNNSLCGEFDKFSVLSEPVYCNFYPQSQTVLKPNQQIYISNNVNQTRMCRSPTNSFWGPSQNKSPVWGSSHKNFSFPNCPNINTANNFHCRDKLSANLYCASPTQSFPCNFNNTYSSCNFNTPFTAQPVSYTPNNLRPLSACSNNSAFTHVYTKGSLLKK